MVVLFLREIYIYFLEIVSHCVEGRVDVNRMTRGLVEVFWLVFFFVQLCFRLRIELFKVCVAAGWLMLFYVKELGWR